MKKWVTIVVSLILALCFLVPLWSQNESAKGIPFIKKIFESGEINHANQLLEKDVQFWLAQANGDTLSSYISFKAEILKRQNKTIKKNIETLEHYLKQFEKYPQIHPRQISDCYQVIADFCEENNETNLALNAANNALDWAKKISNPDPVFMGSKYYNVNVYNNRLGLISESKQATLTALEWYRKAKSLPLEKIYFSYAALANINWYQLKNDSARFYFEKALETVSQMPNTPINKFFRKAMLQNGIMATLREDGKSDSAIYWGYQVIDNYKAFINSSPKPTEVKLNASKEGYCEAIDNLAGVYEEIGNYQKAENLFFYSYEKKKNYWGEAYYGVFISEILIGQHFDKINDLTKAKLYLQKGLKGFQSTDGSFAFWYAGGYATLAGIYADAQKTDSAFYYYNLAGKYFQESNGQELDNIYTDFLRKQALFLAKTKQYTAALSSLSKIKKYLETLNEPAFLQYYYYFNNLAKVNLIAGQYAKAIESADAALVNIKKLFNSGDAAIDSLRMANYIPEILLLQSKAKYFLGAPSGGFLLHQIDSQLNIGLKIIDNHGKGFKSQENLNWLLEEQKDYFDFYAKILLELALTFPNKGYEQRFVALKEGALYNRLRNRLESEKAIQYALIPNSVLSKEQALKERLKSFNINVNSTYDAFQKVETEWTLFLDTLKQQFPQYYQLKYSSLFKELPNFNTLIDKDRTLVRYYWMDTVMAVWIGTATTQRLIVLPTEGIEKNIKSYISFQSSETELLKCSNALYKALWQPIAKDIPTKRVTIIPDGILYNISWDMLVDTPINSFQQIAKHSLLEKYIFSYDYSLWVVAAPKAMEKQWEDYIAFIPGFSDQLKAQYTLSIKDSMNIDYGYLKLLPQPKVQKLAQKMSNQFNGKIVEGKNAIVENLKKEANAHKIIHIATHAKYDNANPNASGLYFSKDQNGISFINLNEIFEIPIHSDLTILTACESGKPGYQDGEGLVSLAHAFNSSGSKNILTGIWKIDEASTAILTEYFLNNIASGQATDIALQNAKIKYIQNVDGRLLSPYYWSGLILMGEPTKVAVKMTSWVERNKLWILGLSGCGLLVLFWKFFNFRKKY
ncbi:MAG TPA: CHAT domain-containing protein [Edaphocola sp.]|nr:CHAT domain-containing protein [Edaphocola sp.]